VAFSKNKNIICQVFASPSCLEMAKEIPSHCMIPRPLICFPVYFSAAACCPHAQASEQLCHMQRGEEEDENRENILINDQHIRRSGKKRQNGNCVGLCLEYAYRIWKYVSEMKE
jgi:hypothetical protein